MKPINWLEKHTVLLCLSLFLGLLACAYEQEQIDTSPNIKLLFSSDTIKFDTLFTSRGSITKRVLITNTNAKAVNISAIRLAGTKYYSLIINGIESQSVENIRLLGGDSLLVLVKIQIDPTDADLPFLVKDSIVFFTNGNQQNIKLLAWGQNATFLTKQTLACNSTWVNTKPYLLTDTIFIDNHCTLNIEAGTRIYADRNAALIVNGTLLVNGLKDSTVKFSGTRFDGNFKKTPGQWAGIVLNSTAKNNSIRYANIQNAVTGISIFSQDSTTLAYTVIENMLESGVSAQNACLFVFNSCINNCVNSLLVLKGGNYRLQYNTFANYAQFPISINNVALRLSNSFTNNASVKQNVDLSAEITNCIIYGSSASSRPDELFYDNNNTTAFKVNVSNSLLRTQKSALQGNNNIINPTFTGKQRLFASESTQNFALDSLSPARSVATPIPAITDDIKGKLRDAQPDIGAYEF
jgi:hypothetical protein